MAKNVIDDGMMITINVRWLIQLVIVVSMAVYGFWQFHARIAELIGSTRSTVTRQICKLREQKIIMSDENDSRFIFSKSL